MTVTGRARRIRSDGSQRFSRKRRRVSLPDVESFVFRLLLIG